MAADGVTDGTEGAKDGLRAPDDALTRLREALSELTAQDAREVLDEARAQARHEVRDLLARALRESMLKVIETELHSATADVPPLPLIEAIGEPAESPRPQAVYVYGVVRTGTELEALPFGVDGPGLVRGVSESGLTALISDVDGAEFEARRLREHMADMGWVQDTARRHEDVIEAVGSQVTVIPMRMCTVYATEEEIRELLRRESRGLREALRYLSGKAEWGVKIFVDPVTSEAAIAQPGADRGRSGAEYVRHRMHEREVRADAAQRAEDAANHVHEVLCTVATDAVLISPQEHDGLDHPGQLLLNGVYLVQDEVSDEFRAQAEALAGAFTELGLDLELTGPWPAYNFVPGTIGAAW